MNLSRILRPLAISAALVLCAPAGLPTQAPPAEKELERLARALRDSKSAADYAKLRAFADANSGKELGSRAALALGYHHYTQKSSAQAQPWLERGEKDPLLREYALFWGAQARRALGQNEAALAKLETLRREFPKSALGDQAVEVLARAALAADRGARALEALSVLPGIERNASLLALRAQASEQAGKLEAAAADYVAVYYGFPLSSEAAVANQRIAALRAKLGKRFPPVSAEQKFARANAIYEARKWSPSRSEFSALLPQLKGAQKELAELRIAQATVRLRGPISALTALKLEEGEVEAERLSTLAQTYRSRGDTARMLDAVEQAVNKYPKSRWTSEALFTAGNSYWVGLDRDQAAKLYRKLFELQPKSENAETAHWRVAWTEYLSRHPAAVERMEEHLRSYSNSSFAPGAVYWLGRAAERDGNEAHARSFYLKLMGRWPETYYGLQADKRMQAIGAGPTNDSEVLRLIPSSPEPPVIEAEIPAAALPAWRRAKALQTVAFDASAELELRAAYAETRAPQLLVAAAQAAHDAGRPIQGVIAARQAVRQLESRRVEDGPESIWRLVYPLPYGSEIQKTAQARDLDPMLVAGLIRQESIFQPDAVSRAGAVGLMQILPSTGRQLARQMKMGYSRARLTDPEYNLQLGTKHLADLIRRFGRLDTALAAYNGGGSRAVRWQAEREHAEPAEFIESIPFVETREYVQNVLRNADVYRRLYGKTP